MVAAAPPLADQVEPQKVQLECDPDSKGSTIEKQRRHFFQWCFPKSKSGLRFGFDLNCDHSQH